MPSAPEDKTRAEHGSTSDSVMGIRVGARIRHGERTLTQADFDALHTATWETGPIHTDREYARTTVFGDIVLSGSCIVGVVHGMVARVGMPEFEKEAGIRVQALLSIENAKFSKPVRLGDTLAVETEILEVRRRPNSQRGVFRARNTATNQNGELVFEDDFLELFEDDNTVRNQGSSSKSTLIR